MTLLLLLLYPNETPISAIPVRCLAILAFLLPRLRNDPRLWLGFAIAIQAGNLMTWDSADNHKYLLGYWCLAVACALAARDLDRVLAISARWLIALGFLFAVSWKVGTPDYLDGSFFNYSLLLDDRFKPLGTMSGISLRAAQVNAAARAALTNYSSDIHFARLYTTSATSALAFAMTWWTLFIETAVAVTFIAPNAKISRWRDKSLLLFVITTYAIAPVTGFGWVLIVMGLAQCPKEARRTQHVYLGAFVLLQLYRFPWRAVVIGGP
jgi:hypothetical protein